ncbi:GNAT family N-acetyltransferase [Hoeflea sp.]|uniref:GNAT family N-acetyltransferase n=1 Tax=Hoeflea sp. TaxID=1940281 RepID=UPI003B52DCEA
MTSVRPATASDLPACAGIINDYIDATPWLPRTITREALEELFTPALLESRIVLVADNDNAIAGYASLDDKAGFLHALYLRPEARRRGVGKALLDATKAARPRGFELTVFEPNTDALRFYLREGLIEVPEGRETDTEENVPTLLMRWKGNAA